MKNGSKGDGGNKRQVTWIDTQNQPNNYRSHLMDGGNNRELDNIGPNPVSLNHNANDSNCNRNNFNSPHRYHHSYIFALSTINTTNTAKLGLDASVVNPNGGAIALGHPVGATGAIIMTKLIYELRRRSARYGMATMCIGGGQGISIIVEAHP